jgi:hypothetical protein
MSNFLHDHYLSKGFSDQSDIEFFLNLSAQCFQSDSPFSRFTGEIEHIVALVWAHKTCLSLIQIQATTSTSVLFITNLWAFSLARISCDRAQRMSLPRLQL